MSAFIVPGDLATYLGIDFDSVQTGRAEMLIGDAVTQALAVATVGTVPATGPTADNLPPGADTVIRPAVARIFLNPAGNTSEGTGPFSYTRPAGTGSMFSKAERATLRRLAGQTAGAFTVDPTPDGALGDYVDPLAQPTGGEGFEYAEETGFTE